MIWERAIEFVLEYEGGYVNDPDDPGGETNFGISKRSYPLVDVAALTIEQAKAIYRRDFWDACRCDELPGQLAFAVFDCAVNQGVPTAKRLLQQALKVKDDGVIGDVTLKAAAEAGVHGLTQFLARRQRRYITTILGNPILDKYALNWSYRVMKLARILFSVPAA